MRDWLSRHWKALIHSSEATFAVAFWIGAVSAGADMTIYIPFLFLAWLVSIIGLATVDKLTVTYKIVSCIAASILMLITGIYLARSHSDDANVLASGAIPEIEPQPLWRLNDNSYTIPIMLTNAGDLPILNRDWLVATLFYTKILSEEEENEVPFFKQSAKNVVQEWRTEVKKDGIQDAIRPGATIRIVDGSVTLTQSQLNDVISGREHVYIFMVMRYSDSKIQKDSLYLAQYCARFVTNGSGFAPCMHRNFSKHIQKKL